MIVFVLTVPIGSTFEKDATYPYRFDCEQTTHYQGKRKDLGSCQLPVLDSTSTFEYFH
jgi:hypothetical protein